VPAIHVFICARNTWMAGPKPGHDVEGASIILKLGNTSYI